MASMEQNTGYHHVHLGTEPIDLVIERTVWRGVRGKKRTAHISVDGFAESRRPNPGIVGTKPSENANVFEVPSVISFSRTPGLKFFDGELLTIDDAKCAFPRIACHLSVSMATDFTRVAVGIAAPTQPR